MGRVEEVIQGNDGRVRVVDVKTAKGIFRRSIHQLAPIPVEVAESETHDEMVEDQTDMESAPVKGNRTLRKRKASTATSTVLKVMLLAGLVLPVFTAPTTYKEAIQVREFTHSAGIYFENIGSGFITSNQWRILTYYDLRGYWASVAAIKPAIASLKNLSRAITNNDYYTEIISQYKHQLQEIENNNVLLRDRNERSAKHRIKRSPLNIVGTIANKLFGILDNDYADQMADTINKVKANEDHLNDLIKKQTSILETTANIIKKNEEERVNQTEAIEQALNLAFEKMRNASSEMKRQKAVQTFNTVSILVAALINECKFMQESILDVITDTHHGRASPLVISPSQLETQIAMIKDNLPADVSLPIIEEKLDITLLYRLMTIECKTMNNLVVFGICVPLVRAEKFEFYSIIRLPSLINNSFVSVTPKMQYLLTNPYRDQFYLLYQTERTECVRMKEDHFLCQQQRPILNKAASEHNCEVRLFLQQSVAPTCSIEVAAPGKIWIQLHSPNHWLFALDKDYDFSFLCDNQLIHRSLTGNGLLIMKPGCSMKDDDLTLTSTNVLQSQFTSHSFQPKLNFTIDDDYDDHPMAPLKISHFIQHRKTFKNLSRELKDLKEHQDDLLDLQPHDIHQVAISYTAMVIVAIIAVYLVINHLRHKTRIVTIRPEPAPRTIHQSSNPLPEDYNFEVK